MAKFQARLQRLKNAAKNAERQIGLDQEIRKILAKIDSALDDESRETANAHIRKLGRILCQRYPKSRVESFLKAIRHNKRFAWEEHSNEPQLQLLDEQVMSKFGEPDNVWYELTQRYDEAVVAHRLLAREMAREDRNGNYLYALYSGVDLTQAYGNHCRYRIARALITLLSGNYLNGEDWGADLLSDLLQGVSSHPTREDASDFHRARGTNCNEPSKFLRKLYEEVPGAEEAVERLLALYNILVRAETLQAQENANKRSQRNGLTVPCHQEQILASTKHEQRLRCSPKGSKEAEFWLRVAAPLLFGASPDHLCKVVNFPQKRGRKIVKEMIDERGTGGRAQLPVLWVTQTIVGCQNGGTRLNRSSSESAA